LGPTRNTPAGPLARRRSGLGFGRTVDHSRPAFRGRSPRPQGPPPRGRRHPDAGRDGAAA